jgi:serine phosphatase RsbU (regulator of sigma subunit)
MLDIRAAVAKIGRFSPAESGDTIEVIELPGGGFSFVIIDAEGTGRGAKTLSNLLATRAIVRLKDGAQDAAVARAIHDYLYTYHMGQAMATLNILSIDFASGMLRVTRNNPATFFVLSPKGMQTYNEPSSPIGLYNAAAPILTELPVEPYTYVVLFTDGLLHAGEHYGEDIELAHYLETWPVTQGLDPENLAQEVLARALEVDQGEPSDDMSILVLAVLPSYASDNQPDDHLSYPVRHLSLSVPFERT